MTLIVLVTYGVRLFCGLLHMQLAKFGLSSGRLLGDLLVFLQAKTEHKLVSTSSQVKSAKYLASIRSTYRVVAEVLLCELERCHAIACVGWTDGCSFSRPQINEQTI